MKYMATQTYKTSVSSLPPVDRVYRCTCVDIVVHNGGIWTLLFADKGASPALSSSYFMLLRSYFFIRHIEGMFKDNIDAWFQWTTRKQYFISKTFHIILSSINKFIRRLEKQLSPLECRALLSVGMRVTHSILVQDLITSERRGNRSSH